jgi:hypothetical protein
MRIRHFFIAATLALSSAELAAWGPEGHRVIGRAAFERLDETARERVLDVLGDPAPGEVAAALSEACNWPDGIRDEAGWRWSAPLHYVNIPRHSDHYERERDCPDGLCVTEGVLQFASHLAYGELRGEKGWQALAFVCHLVADLHQPLHAGFRDDRGGNTVEVRYRGEDYNLHRFWDGVLVRERLEDEDGMVQTLAAAGTDKPGPWNPREVVAWTDASHALARDLAYPDGPEIDAAFADRCWSVTTAQWERAARRLARVLNAVLGEAGVVLEEVSEVARDPETDAAVP